LNTKCLIIAAGRGRRLSERGDSKPLIPLLGLPLIQRVILAAESAGLSEFIVVTGYNHKPLEAFLNQLASSGARRITCVYNDEWDKENGISVLKARPLLHGNFILLMADHIFDPSILLHLLEEKVGDDEVILAVDRNVSGNQLVDPNDVTKVLVDDGRIVGIGKTIEDFNAYDTGIFRCSQAIFEGIEQSIREGDSTLSGAVRVLAERGKARAFNIENALWIDIDDDAALRRGEKQLLSTLYKNSDGPVARFLNRPVSTALTRQLVRTPLTPNIISFISFVIAIVAAVFFFLPGYTNLLIGGLLAQLASIVDGCDGEIARLKLQITEFGGWFDAVLDRYADALLLLGMTYHSYYSRPESWVWAVGFLAIIGAFMNSYTADKYDGLMRRRLGPGASYFRLGRDVRIFIILLGAVANLPLVALIIIAVVMNFENVRRVRLLYNYEGN